MIVYNEEYLLADCAICRLASSIWSIISDCDEVYNYWEPLHLLLFNRGFQTWEYSPIYAIRSWFYIYIHYLPAQLLSYFLVTSKITLFYAVRFLIAFVNISADLLFYESITKRLGNQIGFFYIIFSMFSVGMFSASCAFLPSSFSMTMNVFAMAAYLQEQWFYAILCTCISTVVGWPFAVILGLPIVIEMFVIRVKLLSLRFIVLSLLSTLLVFPLVYLIDSYYYGKPTFAFLNIVLYNVFTSHGSELYGVEPASFYLKNLFLNWNILLIFFAFSLPLSLHAFVRNNSIVLRISDQAKIEFTIAYWYRFIPVMLIFLSTSTWLLIFMIQAHKEERFLFPIFPLIAVLAAVGLDAFLQIWKGKKAFGFLCIVFYVVLSLSRGYALHRNYSASIDIYRDLNDYFTINNQKLNASKFKDPIRVCVGKEWYRFPSSFFLPEKITDKNVKRSVELRFIKSEFRGLLPGQFAKGLIPHITKIIPTALNNMNLEEASCYVPLNTCDFIVDLNTGKTTEIELDFAAMKDQFSIVIKKPFLLALQSHNIFRAFYVPFKNDYLKFGDYFVLKKL